MAIFPPRSSQKSGNGLQTAGADSGLAMKSRQFRPSNAQIVGGIQDDRFIKLPGVKGDFRETLEQDRIGNQPQRRVETKGGNRAKHAGGQGVHFRRAGEGGFTAADILGQTG